MARVETEIMTGWRFALGETLPADEAFSDIYLPHDWALSMPVNPDMAEGDTQGFRDRWGIGWYRKTLHLESKVGENVYYLEFGGVFEDCTIWINGQKAGGNHFGYSTFKLDVTAFLNAGDNELLVRVNNTLHPADRWYSGCGIYRTVKLIQVNQLHFDPWEVFVTTKISGNTAKVTVNTGVAGAVKAVLTKRASNLIVAKNTGNTQLELMVANPCLWSADEPNLYDLELTLYDGEQLCDRIRIAVGIREIIFDSEKGMLVNGKPEILKGLCLHQDVGCRGIAAKKEMWRARLLELKEMGCNAVRTAHHVFSSEFIELCDELGFYVYEEPFDKWVYWANARYFEEEWQKDTDAMVKRDRNHPSIVIWGVGNEETNQGQTAFFNNLKMLYDYVKSLDSTRPVTYAMKPHFWYDAGPDVEDPMSYPCDKRMECADRLMEILTVYPYEERLQYAAKIGQIVDVLCCNYMDQWYPQLHELLPGKLIIGTEVYQYFAGEPDNMQNFSVKVPSLVPQQLDYCIGSFIWTGIDYLGESAMFPFKGRCNAPLRTNNNRRPMFYILQSYWDKKPMVHFSVLDYSIADEGTKWHWGIPPYVDHWEFPHVYKQLIPYVISSNCEEVSIKLNEDTYLLPRPCDCENRLITGYLPYQPGTVTVTGYIGGKGVCSHQVVTPGPAAKLVFEKTECTVPAEEGYEQLFAVKMLDADGNPVFRDSSLVSFRAEGVGEVIAVDSGDLSSNDSYQQSQLKLYQGQGCALIRFSGQAGEVTLWAEAPGVESAKTLIVVK